MTNTKVKINSDHRGKLRLVCREQMVKVKGKKMSFLRLKKAVTIDGDDLRKTMSKISYVPESHVAEVLVAQQEAFLNFLINGHNINMPGIGAFSLSLHARAHENIEDVSVEDDIEYVKVLFRPCREVLGALKNVEFELDETRYIDGRIVFNGDLEEKGDTE